MIESWIDTLVKVWEFDCGNGQMVRSYRLVEKAEFPTVIDPGRDFPLALTIPSGVRPEYSLGGPLLGFWNGITEFHVSPNLDKSLMPSLVRWYGKIVRAAAGSMTLGGLVEYFVIADQEDAVSGPIALQYGAEAEHWGFLVRWTVKERITLTVSA